MEMCFVSFLAGIFVSGFSMHGDVCFVSFQREGQVESKGPDQIETCTLIIHDQ